MKLLKRSGLEHVYRAPKGRNKHLLLIHGYGANEHDLFGLAPYIPAEWGILSLCAPIDLPWGGYAWYHISMEGGGLRQDISSAVESQKRIVEALDELREGVDPEKLVYLGFSQGAILGWSIGLEYPQKIDGLAALSGFWNKDILQEKADFEGLGRKAIFMSHGTMDEVIDIRLPRASQEELASNGLQVQLREYPQGHGIGPQNLEDLLQWLDTI